MNDFELWLKDHTATVKFCPDCLQTPFHGATTNCLICGKLFVTEEHSIWWYLTVRSKAKKYDNGQPRRFFNASYLVLGNALGVHWLRRSNAPTPAGMVRERATSSMCFPSPWAVECFKFGNEVHKREGEN